MPAIKNTYSQGPWHIDEVLGHKFALIDAEGFVVLRINGGMIPIKANARLLAAAPDLLKAATQALNRLAGGAGAMMQQLTDEQIIGNLRLALANAKG